jgi:hypothetical protein
MNNKFRPLLEATALVVIAFGFHYLLLHFAWSPRRLLSWQYDLMTIYGFFYVCSVAIVLVLIRMKQKNIDSVGNTFMLLTCIKAAVSYVLLHPILQSKHNDVAFEKANFFAAFAIFLAIETIVSVRLLQKN